MAAGKQTDFPRAVALQPGETIAVVTMSWKDKADRDRCFAAMAERAKTDPAMSPEAMPYDGARMVIGGFITLAEAE